MEMFFDPKSLAKDEAMANDMSKRRYYFHRRSVYWSSGVRVTSDLLIDTRLDEFYNDIVKAVEREDQIISKVFPSPTTVIAQLLQRIFEQRVFPSFCSNP